MTTENKILLMNTKDVGKDLLWEKCSEKNNNISLKINITSVCKKGGLC
ncbi:MAG: hypothetical protein ACYCXB_09360 [Candidatus Humimicrobiaceae bacterium]